MYIVDFVLTVETRASQNLCHLSNFLRKITIYSYLKNINIFTIFTFHYIHAMYPYHTDDLTSKADVLMREMSNRSALISQMSPLKMGSRREQSDITGMMTQRKDTAALTYNDQSVSAP